MSCDVNKFIISKGSDNTFIFVIKQDDSTLPLTIKAGDTFVGKLINLDTEVEYHLPTNGNDFIIEDSANGKISLTIDADDTHGLVALKGSSVDRYYLRPTYKLVIECDTENNGQFIAKVPEVYVD